MISAEEMEGGEVMISAEETHGEERKGGLWWTRCEKKGDGGLSFFEKERFVDDWNGAEETRRR